MLAANQYLLSQIPAPEPESPFYPPMPCHGRLDLPPPSINKTLAWRASPAMPPLNQQFNDIFMLDVIASPPDRTGREVRRSNLVLSGDCRAALAMTEKGAGKDVETQKISS